MCDYYHYGQYMIKGEYTLILGAYVETIIDEKLPQIIASYLLGIQTGQTSNPLPASYASDLPATNVTSAAERVVKEVGKNENDMEKDV